MYEQFLKLREQRAADEEQAGFTLIELLIVIVVLGILAATVIFALGGVTGQSAVAACNSDAKTTEVAVQAYISSPDNSTNAPPTAMADLYSHTFTVNGVAKTDTFETNQNNSAYTVYLGKELGTVAAITTIVPATVVADGVYVVDANHPATATQYDAPGQTTATNPCGKVT